MNPIFPDYPLFLTEIKTLIRTAQYEALKAVNTQLIRLYWTIGERIVSKQQAEGWGKSVVEQLAQDLQNEFPGIQGFSARNIWNMRQFYLTYSKHPILQPLVAEIAWSHNMLIVEKCKDELQREFYIRMTQKFGWTKNVLRQQIEAQAYEKYLLGQSNFDETLPEKYRNQAKLALKDDYTFGFLELADEHTEHELEKALIANIRRFLTEMGGYYAFIGNQYRMEVGGQEFFIDLLLFHRKLKALVAIELKIGEFKPEYAGKMQFYLSVLNDTVKTEDENPSIGIIICQSKNRIIVEYALKNIDQPIGVSSYRIQEELPKELEHLLPTAAEIKEKMDKLFL
jgi:predicted nuclease of restriction endonuclease-like (RecB) superfamily